MRLALLLSLGLILAGCVPTADFVGLRDEVRQVQAENRKLKDEVLKRLAEQDRGGDLSRRLDTLDAKVESLRVKQQGFDQKLGELLRRADETSRREEAAAKPPEPAPGHDAKAEGPVDAPPQPGGFEAAAVITPTALYNQAYNDYLKGNYDLAISGFGELLKKFPGVSQSAHAQYWIGRSHYNKKAYRQALETHARVIAEYPKSDKVPAALFEMGVAHAELGDVVKAKERLKLVIEKYPQSNEASRARLKLADLK